jgi:cytochrome c oxidase accessory protein FixG
MSDAYDNSDPDVQLFAKRKRVYPKYIQGFYRNRKWWTLRLGLLIYYLAPFIRWDRGPHAPDQAILIDMAGRRAYWFFFEIWPQEVYYLTGILIFAAVMLFFITALFGRVWCGYFCFQTVWTDFFIWVERVVQGDRAERMKLDAAPWTLRKVIKKVITHLAWAGIALLTGGAFVLYFNDAPTLMQQLFTGQLSNTIMVFIAGLTASTYIMAGLAREQVCTYMCPYARFQSGMFDQDTLIVTYDAARGEPRAKHKKGDSWEGRGHCIDCTQCVQVCPTGIDIRNGLQLECIACGLCIDACDSVMDKVGLPHGLIRYETDRNLKIQPKGAIITQAPKLRLVRPRTIYYALVLVLVGGLILFNLMTRHLIELHVVHDRNPLYVALSDGTVRNGYELNIVNKDLQPRRYRVELEGLPSAVLTIRGVAEHEISEVVAKANDSIKLRAFIVARVPVAMQTPIRLRLVPLDGGQAAAHESMFMSHGAQ